MAVQGLQADAAFVAEEDGVFEAVDALVLVALAVDPAALGWLGQVARDELGLDEPAVVLQCGGEAAAALLGEQLCDVQARGPVVQRPRESQQLVPLLVDEVGFDAVAQQRLWDLIDDAPLRSGGAGCSVTGVSEASSLLTSLGGACWVAALELVAAALAVHLAPDEHVPVRRSASHASRRRARGRTDPGRPTLLTTR